MKFKTEITLLLSAIGLYILSAFCYSYEALREGWLPFINYPYKDYALPLAVLASILLVIAAISYSKRK